MPRDENTDWLGDLRWQGYPRLQPIADAAARSEGADEPAAHRRRPAPDSRRLESLARENEALRAKLEEAGRLVGEFEKRLAEAGASYEGALLEAESGRRQAELERERLSGELDSAKAELARLAAREPAREAELTLERERRALAEKERMEILQRARELGQELIAVRAKAAELTGAAAELRRQADSAHESLVRAKALTDQDVRLLRQELRDFLIKIHDIQASSEDKK